MTLIDTTGFDPRVRLLPVGHSRWRVTDRAGRALGMLTAQIEHDRDRYRAERFHAATGRFREVGAFWNLGEALECLRLSR